MPPPLISKSEAADKEQEKEIEKIKNKIDGLEINQEFEDSREELSNGSHLGQRSVPQEFRSVPQPQRQLSQDSSSDNNSHLIERNYSSVVMETRMRGKTVSRAHSYSGEKSENRFGFFS